MSITAARATRSSPPHPSPQHALEFEAVRYQTFADQIAFDPPPFSFARGAAIVGFKTRHGQNRSIDDNGFFVGRQSPEGEAIDFIIYG